MNYQDFRNNALETIRAINANLKRSILDDAAKFDLSDSQLFVMGYLKEHGKANIGKLAREFNTDCANISPMCKKLEKRGFLKRERSTEDERVVFVMTTKQGNEVVDDVFGRLDAKLKKTFGAGKEDLDKVLRNLKDLAASFEETLEE